MREIALDTETTGLEVEQGHRVIEIGCVELLNRRPTGEHFHCYLQPGRQVDPAAMAIHGISDEFLADKPQFSEVAQSFLEFVAGARLIIHNAPFDLGFLDNELSLVGAGSGGLKGSCSVLDTLVLARRMNPGQRASLDALCKRYGVNNSNRELHGALLDARILADVYLAMTSGQVALALESHQNLAPRGGTVDSGGGGTARGPQHPSLIVIEASEAEARAHAEYLDILDQACDGACVWRRYQG